MRWRPVLVVLPGSSLQASVSSFFDDPPPQLTRGLSRRRQFGGVQGCDFHRAAAVGGEDNIGRRVTALVGMSHTVKLA